MTMIRTAVSIGLMVAVVMAAVSVDALDCKQVVFKWTYATCKQPGRDCSATCYVPVYLNFQTIDRVQDACYSDDGWGSVQQGGLEQPGGQCGGRYCFCWLFATRWRLHKWSPVADCDNFQVALRLGKRMNPQMAPSYWSTFNNNVHCDHQNTRATSPNAGKTNGTGPSCVDDSQCGDNAKCAAGQCTCPMGFAPVCEGDDDNKECFGCAATAVVGDSAPPSVSAPGEGAATDSAAASAASPSPSFFASAAGKAVIGAAAAVVVLGSLAAFFVRRARSSAKQASNSPHGTTTHHASTTQQRASTTSPHHARASQSRPGTSRPSQRRSTVMSV